jgi:carboxypeptidase Q
MRGMSVPAVALAVALAVLAMPVTGPAACATGRIVGAALVDDWAYDTLGELCDRIGQRLAGSPRMAAAIDWAVATLARAGFDSVWTEAVTITRWVRGEEEGQVVAPVAFPLRLTALGTSVGTPAAGLEAEVLAVRDFAELDERAGEAVRRIVLFDEPWEGYGKSVRYRWRGASAAARHGAVACLIRSVTGNSLATPHTGVMSYVDSLPRIPAAAITIEDAGRLHRLCDRGLRPRVQLRLGAHAAGEVTSANVVADLRGRERPQEIVLLGAHLDSWDLGTGAHDDGAGCAIVMGAARLLHELGLRPRRTVRVVLFESEEFGGQGGEAYHEAHAGEIARHVAALESDSGAFAPDGFSVRGDSLAVLRVRELAAPLAHLGAAAVVSGGAGVDVGPIVRAGVPGIGHRTDSGGRYMDYHHSPADTFDKIDPAELARNVAVVAALAFALAEDPQPLPRRSEDPVQ